jgi:uncharacterized protein YndB with AHSA1/START domain
MEQLGQMTTSGETRELRFERRLAHPPEDVWAALTEQERVGDWLTTATIDARPGGEIALEFGPDNVVVGRITTWEPFRGLAYGWRFPDGHDSRVSWTLAADGDGTRLTLVHQLLRPAEAAGYGAGWHAYVERLAGHLDGEAPDFWPRFEELRPRYERMTA